jgi:aldehyde dehydrogenase (NAD+)
VNITIKEKRVSSTEVQHLGHSINGELVHSSDRIEVVDPTTEQVIATVPAGSAADVDRAVEAAATAFQRWSRTSVAGRAAVVRAISQGLSARRDELAALITSEMGSPIKFSTQVQASLPAATSRGIAELLFDGFSFEEEIGNSLVVREPVGVVGCITPWNYPLHQVVAKVVPAIAAGNTVVLKPSEIAPLSANVLAEICEEAGVPPGVLNVVHGTGDVVGEAISRHPRIDMVSFTGSTRAGRLVSAAAAASVKRVTLELGGKSANVLLDDADFAKAAKLGVAYCFINGGQTCSALTRMLVPAERHDEVVAYAVAAAEKYSVGNPFDEGTRIGPVASAQQRDRVRGYYKVGEDEATLEIGGVGAHNLPERGYFVAPTIFSGVTHEMTIAQEEIFGPALAIMPYADEDDAISIANSTVYGLSGAVFSASDQRALEFAKHMRTGQVDVNGGAFNPMAPFGGYRQSGNGRELGHHGLAEFTEVKSIQR